MTVDPTGTATGRWLPTVASSPSATAKFYGSMGGKPLNSRWWRSRRRSTGHGYYEVASDGGIFAFGNAPFYGSMGGKPLNKPIVEDHGGHPHRCRLLEVGLRRGHLRLR